MASRELIDKVRKATDMVELAGEYTILKRTGDILSGKCPHPDHEDSTPSFTIWEEKQTWCCYGCHSGNKNGKTNFGSDCFAFLQWISKGTKSFGQCLKELADRAGIVIDENDPDANLHEKNKSLALKFHRMLTPEVVDYLEGRGLDLDDIARWQIGFDGKRIVFPLHDQHGHVKGFSRRVMPGLGEQFPKYRNSSEAEGFIKREYLYGMQHLDRSWPDIWITEGQIDLILASKAGFKNLVCPLGSSFTEQHADIIVRLKMNPGFIMDGDAAGIKAMTESSRILARRGVSSRYVILPDGMDLADMCQKYPDMEWNMYVEDHTKPYWHLLSSESIDRYNAKVDEASIRLYQELLPQYNSLVNSADKAAFAAHVWRMSHINLAQEMEEAS